MPNNPIRLARKGKGKTIVQYMEFGGNMGDVDVARFARGRLKGGSGRFVIEIEDEDGNVQVVNPWDIIVRSGKPDDHKREVLHRSEFREKYTTINPEEADQ
jgi:hypothetical protein